ncbi:NAD(P)H-hydrate dehydratase [Ammonifex thiophilus]|uniref:Bifunctional NAD(P)H-hydrate repair enzyme n=1 Tax=Ammonifex thiophilus TaxID=444093 RepID=A0A3D8P5Y1_9THEO|nr:NAD(P)H-hydrate dehydratase [Ammonifex thiophilus]RDV83254.1 NAD(P)H-hydrate dehydratase [Ammonifex thiophilus]
MRLVTAAEMREIDRRAMEEYGIPSIVLMENAGRWVAQVVASRLGRVAGKRVVVLCGRGNNGGDGLVAARHLWQQGAQVKVFLAAEPESLRGDALTNATIWRRLGQDFYPLLSPTGPQAFKLAIARADAVIDALYGTGFRGELPPEIRPVVEALNASGRFVVAVDIPSGLEADTGQVRGVAVVAHVTVTFGLPKLGLVLEPGVRYVGELLVADISLPLPLIAGNGPGRYYLTGEMVRSWLPSRPPTAHKGNFGHVLVVGGSRGMIGAACLTAAAAMRAGAGLVTLAVPRSWQEIAAAKLTEVMTLGLPETPEGQLSCAAWESLKPLLPRFTVCALGPGLGRHPETVELVKRMVAEIDLPLVLDADGINAFAGEAHLLKRRSSPLILTPHPGEMARLLGVKAAELADKRVEVAERAAREWEAVVVLKGARTVVAAPDGYTGINSTGNPGMATGGTGDVLTGVIAALWAQGLDPFRAAAAGVYLHGLAGDLAAEEKGEAGLVAGDLLEKLPLAWRHTAATEEAKEQHGLSCLG